ncbi:MAG: class I SAM-dependent methyltransferase [Burkholderiales bacterium]|nr:class I SAM-dependent methyltransferase [Burkholderiales bacterium]
MGADLKFHWENVHRTKVPEALSWYRPHLDRSMFMIQRVAGSLSSAIIDIGGGESTLVDDLLGAGYRDLSVLDISETALEVARKRLGESAGRIHWIVGDIVNAAIEPRRYDVWHDRALFHFLTDRAARTAYVAQAARSVRPGGHVLVATFGSQGPTKCSGLDVVRYDAESLHHEFGSRFRLLESATEAHTTPLGTTQQFLYCLCKVG